MYPLDPVYGRLAYQRFVDNHGWPAPERNGTSFRQSVEAIASEPPLLVRSYTELIEVVSFLGVMNKRHNLYFRGQHKDWPLVPTIFRSHWTALDGTQFQIPATKAARIELWNHLNDRIGPLVLAQCQQHPMPRENTLKMFREARWAVAQHYELWPTPLIDITPNLRIAASFALLNGRKEGMLYVVAMPANLNSITFDADQHIVLARLNAVCPPAAKRPHYQDGFLVGRFPFDSPTPNLIDSDPCRFSNLNRRIIAKIKLIDSCESDSKQVLPPEGFWSADFPRISEAALLPSRNNDVLLDAFMSKMKQMNTDMRRICSMD